MLRFFYVAVGGAVGALLRYLITGVAYRTFSGMFPWGTFIVNLTGSLVIGFLWGVLEVAAVSQNVRLLLIVGVLGSYTTYSTFSLENFDLGTTGL